MSLSQIRKNLLKWKETLHQKTTQDSGERKARSESLKHRKLAIDLLEERNLLSITVANANDLMINQPDPAATIPNFLAYETMALAGNNQMTSGNDVGDFVTTWAQEEPAWMRNEDGSIMVDAEGNYIPYINLLTGLPYMESNIYARYFTDEVQKVTIPEELLKSSATGSSIGNFSLTYGGNEVQRLTFSTTSNPYSSYTAEIVGTFRIGGIQAHGENAPEDWVTIHYNESFGAEYTAKLIQTALEGLGPYMKGVIVTPINSREFDIEFANDYWFGKDVPELQISTQSFSSGFLAGAEVTTISEPINITFYQEIDGVVTDVGIPVYVPTPSQQNSASAWQVAATQTANAITAAFAQYSTSEFYGPINSNVWVADEVQHSYLSAPLISTFQVPEVQVTVVNSPKSDVKSSTDTSNTYVFEIAFVNNSGKINHPELVMTSARDAGGNQYIDASSYAVHQTNLYVESIDSSIVPVTTIKETSDAFRVNPAEVDDPWTPGPDTTFQYKPVVAMDADGDFVIAWETEVNDPVDKPYDQYDIYAQRFTLQSVLPSGAISPVTGEKLLYTADGKEYQCIKSVGSAFKVNDNYNGIQTDPTIACDLNGNFVVGWTSYAQDASYFLGVFARWYDRDGSPLSMDVQVSHEYTMTCYNPRVAMSDEGHTVVTWNETTAPNHRLYKSVFPAGSTIPIQTLDAVVVNSDAIDASVAFDSNNRYVISYTSPGWGVIDEGTGLIEGRDIYAEMFAMERVLVESGDEEVPNTYEWTETQTRESFRVNSYEIGTRYTWHSQQLVPSVGIDADGDIFIGYQGYLPDADQMHTGPSISYTMYYDENYNEYQRYYSGGNVAVGFDYQDSSGYFYEHFVNGKNEDLIPFFLRYGSTIAGIDVDAAIRNVLIPCMQNGATPEQLGRMSLIMESVLGKMRGASSDIGLGRIDADLTTSGGSSAYLVTDSIVNATRDGSNTRFFITIPKTSIASGTIRFRIYRQDSIGTNYQDISFTIAVDSNSHQILVGDTMDNIRAAFNEAWLIASETWQGDDTEYDSTYVEYINCYDPGDNTAVDEENEETIYARNWQTYRVDTPWEIPFSDIPGAYNTRYSSVGWHIFEITLTGGAHDTMIGITSQPVANGMGVIRWYGDNNDTSASSCVGAPPSMSSAYETYGNSGTGQLGASVVVSTAGSYTMTWAQETSKSRSGTNYPTTTAEAYYGQAATVANALSSPYYNVSLNPYSSIIGVSGTERNFVASNLYYRNFVESTDTAGPRITDYYLPDGSHLADGDQVTNALKSMVVVFDEQMLSIMNYGSAGAAEHGIENVKNWILLKDGVEVKNGIEKIEFGLNASKALAEQAHLANVKGGVLANGTNKWEAVVTFYENSVNHSLSGGQYTLVCKNSVADMAGNVLNRDGLNQSGYNTSITFNVSIMDGYLGFDPGEIDDTNFNSEEHVVNDVSTRYDVGNDIIVESECVPYVNENGKLTWVDPRLGDQVLREDDEKYYPVDDDMESSGRTVASDGEGNFAVVWVSNEKDAEGVFLRKYRTKTVYGINGTSEVQETIDTIRITDNPTAKQATVAMDGDGDIVVAWAQEITYDGQTSYDIVFNYFVEEQIVLKDEIIAGGRLIPKYYIDHDGNGKFDPKKDTPSCQIDDDGKVYYITANTEREFDQQHPSVSMSTEGDFTIVWESYYQDGSGWGVFGQRFAPDCSKLGGLNCVQEIQFTGSPTGGTFRLVYVEYDGDDQSAWWTDKITISQNTFTMREPILLAMKDMEPVPQSEMGFENNKATRCLSFNVNPDDEDAEYDKDGNPVDVKIKIVSMSRILVEFTGETYGNQTQPQLTVYELEMENPRPNQSVKGVTTVDGNSGEFQVNLTTEFDQRFPSIAMTQDGEFVVTWTSWSRTGAGQELYADVYARKFVASSSLRLSGSQTTTNYTLNDSTPYVISNDDPANHEVQTGMGYDGVVYITVNSPYGSWSGSGTLLASGFHILTAAHVVCDEFGNPVDPAYFTVTFHTTDDWSGQGIDMQVAQVFAHPTYEGTATFTQTSDIAVLQLVSQAPLTAERYDIYRGRDELGKLMTKVGYGVTADENFMIDDYSGGVKRIGTNNYDLLGQSFDPMFNAELLLHDFDDGTTANDYFGNQYGIRNTGTGFANEVASASGDSGGPGFIDGKIAGVTSGGQYIFDGDGNRYKPPGSVSFDVRVSGYADWIDAIMSGGGNEILVNQTIAGDQLWSDVAIDSDGGFVVTWTHAMSTEGSVNLPPAYSIYARRFDTYGNPLQTATQYWGGEFLVSSVTAAHSTDIHQAFSKISMTPMGDFVITWEGLSDRFNPGDGEYDFDIFARRYVNNRDLTTINENGIIIGYGLVGDNGAIGSQFNVNKTTEGDQRAASVALDSTGDMVFVWNGYTDRLPPKKDDEGVDIFDDMDILYRRVTVPEDISAPFVTDVVAIAPIYEEVINPETNKKEEKLVDYKRTQILEGSTIKETPTMILLTVSEEIFARYAVDSRSILNKDNWVLYKDGYISNGAIVNIIFNRIVPDNPDDYDPYIQGRNTAYLYTEKGGFYGDLNGDGVINYEDYKKFDTNGDGILDDKEHEAYINACGPRILDYRTGKIEIILVLDGDLNKTGHQGLENGEYMLQFAANAEDLAGNQLDGAYDGRSGSNFQRNFYIGNPNSDVIKDPYAEPWDPTDPVESGYETKDIAAYVEDSLSIHSPAIAMRPDGSFVVVSVEDRTTYDEDEDTINTTNGDDIIVRLFDRNGNPIGTERIVNNYTIGGQTNPDVAIDSYGNFVVTWVGVSATSSSTGLHARVFDRFGNPVSTQFQLTSTDAYQATPKITLNDDGTFLVTWIGRDQRSGSLSRADVVYAQVFSFNGTRILETFNGTATNGPIVIGASSDATANCIDVDIASSLQGGIGRYVITWTAYDASNKTVNVFARTMEYNLTTKALTAGTAFRVNTGITGDQSSPAVAMAENTGDFVITWNGPNADQKSEFFSRGEIYARAFTFGGSPISLGGTTSDFRVNTYGVGEQILPDVAIAGDASRIIFTWTSFDEEPNSFDPNAGYYGATQHDYGVFARVLNKSGYGYVDPSDKTLAGSFLINRTQLGDQSHSVVAMDEDGDFSIAWVGPHVEYSEIPDEGATVFYGPGVPTNVYVRSYRPNGIHRGTQTSSTLSSSTYSSKSSSLNTYSDVLLSASTTISRTGLQQFDADYIRPSGGGYTNIDNISSLDIYKIEGTSGNDVLTIVPGATSGSWVVKLNGKTLSVPSGATAVVFNGNGGSDHVSILGTEDDETATFNAETKSFAFTGATLTFVGFDVSQITLDGAGGKDTIEITTSKTNDDTLDLGFGELLFSGADILLSGKNFEQVRAISGGGKDVAVLRDSKDDDILEMSSNFAIMSGIGYTHELSNFAKIDAYSESGNDTAIFYSSVMGSDELLVNEYGVTLSSLDGSYWNRAKGFTDVVVHGSGTNNNAVIDGSKKDSDSLVITDKSAEMNYGNGMTVTLDGFQNATINAGAGISRATVSNLTRFVGYDDHCVFSTGATTYQLNQFAETVVYANTSQSSLATLNLSSGITATVKSLGRSAVVNTGGLDLYTLIAFDQVLANKENGGRAGVVESSVDFLFTNGNWED